MPEANRTTSPASERGRNVNRIIDVLNCFSEREPVHSLTTISEHLGLPRSTTHRLMSALVAGGLLMREANGRGYQLGYQLLRWGMVAQSALELRNEALPFLRSLVTALDETAVLTVRDGVRCVYAETVESTQPVRLTKHVGQPLHLHAGSSSKVLLAFLPPAEMEDILSTLELPALARNTITDPDRLRDELQAIRQRGYATSFEETDSEAAGVTAPVFDCHGRLVAGIGVVAPVTRLFPERVPAVAPVVVDAARQLSLRLGAPDPLPGVNPG